MRAGLTAAAVASAGWTHAHDELAASQAAAPAVASSPAQVPVYEVDPAWPRPLPDRWLVGAIAGVAVDERQHVWIVHRPGTLQPNETRSIWRAAPPVLEFDQAGNVVSAWGGPGEGYEWPDLEHGIHVDDGDHVWLGGGGEKDAQLLKFTRQGKFVLQIGRKGAGTGSNDIRESRRRREHDRRPRGQRAVRRRRLRQPPRHRLRRRHRRLQAPLGRLRQARRTMATSRRPASGCPVRSAAPCSTRTSRVSTIRTARRAPQFRIVHAVRIARDGLVYVCDRTNDRMQVFRKDGTFVQEAFIAKKTLGSGSVWDIGFSTDPAQTFLIVPDGTNQQVWILRRDTLRVVSAFGRAGHWAGQFYGAHNLAVDGAGHLYITETYEGKRVQKFVYRGLGPATTPIIQ